MIFKHYTDMKKFTEENGDLILEKEWLNNLMVGNCEDGLKYGIDENWLLASLVDNDKTELILLLRRPWNLLLYSPTNNVSDELYKYVAEQIAKIDTEIPGVNAEKEIANKFARYYCKITGKNIKSSMPMRILLLEKIKESKLRDDVSYRKANINDKEVLKKFIFEFYEEALNKKLSDEELEIDFNKHAQNNFENYFVLEKDGKIVAQTTSSRKLKKGKCISGVYTQAQERGNGYAYNLVYRITKRFLDNGAEYCVLYTDDKNPISNHVYEKIGYKRMVDTEDIDFI